MCFGGSTCVDFNFYLQCLHVTKYYCSERHRNKEMRYNLILVKKIFIIDGPSAVSSFYIKQELYRNTLRNKDYCKLIKLIPTNIEAEDCLLNIKPETPTVHQVIIMHYA
jgi:hypothetical protein